VCDENCFIILAQTALIQLTTSTDSSHTNSN